MREALERTRYKLNDRKREEGKRVKKGSKKRGTRGEKKKKHSHRNEQDEGGKGVFGVLDAGLARVVFFLLPLFFSLFVSPLFLFSPGLILAGMQARPGQKRLFFYCSGLLSSAGRRDRGGIQRDKGLASLECCSGGGFRFWSWSPVL